MLDPMKTAIAASLILLALVAGGCASQRNASEAAWQRAQCEQINDDKLREKCVERVDKEF
jgi:hypothetical protein